MHNDHAVDYETLGAQLDAMLRDETCSLANAANFVALVFHALPDINWLGIYVLRDDELVLGPFQGKPACTRIAIGQGVCGKAAARMTTLRIPDVHEFDGHIVCDPESRSEIVIPLIRDGRLLGVLDVDSPKTDRFGERDQAGLESICKIFGNALVSNGEAGII